MKIHKSVIFNCMDVAPVEQEKRINVDEILPLLPYVH